MGGLKPVITKYSVPPILDNLVTVKIVSLKLAKKIIWVVVALVLLTIRGFIIVVSSFIVYRSAAAAKDTAAGAGTAAAVEAAAAFASAAAG